MRRILLAAVLVAVAAPASAETAIWTGEVHVEKWVTDDGSEFYWLLAGSRVRKHPGRSVVHVRWPHLHGRIVLHHEHAAVSARGRRGTRCTGHPADRPRSGVAGRWAAVRARRPRPELPRSGRGGVGQLRARLAGRSGGVGAARTGGDTGSGAAGRRCRPARPRTARQGVATMTADSR